MCQCGQCQDSAKPSSVNSVSSSIWITGIGNLNSGSINSVSSWLPLLSDKSHLDIELTIQEKWLLAVCGRSRIRLTGTTVTHWHSLPVTQKSSWICLSTPFPSSNQSSSPCNGMHQSSSSNSHCKLKSMKILLDLSLDHIIASRLTWWSNKHFAVSAYGIGKEGQKSSCLSLVCLLPVAC